jgi:hypothetical protein
MIEVAVAASESSPAEEFDDLFDEVMGLCAAPAPVVHLPGASPSVSVSAVVIDPVVSVVPSVPAVSVVPGLSSEGSAVLELVMEAQAAEPSEEESMAATTALLVVAPRVVLPRVDVGEFVEALPESLEEKEEVVPAQQPTGFFAGHRWGYRSFLIPGLTDIEDVSEEEEKREEEVAAREAELRAVALIQEKVEEEEEEEEAADRKFITAITIAQY